MFETLNFPKRPVYLDSGEDFAWVVVLLFLTIMSSVFLPPFLNVLCALILGIILTTVLITGLSILWENRSRYRKWEQELSAYQEMIQHSYIVMPNDQHEKYQVEKFRTLGQLGYDNRIRFLDRDEEIMFLLHTGYQDRNSANG